MKASETSLIPSVRIRISPKGARCGMAQQKAKVKTLEATTFSNRLTMKIILKLGLVGHKNSIIWNHKDSDLIHVNLNHAKSNHIGPINDSSDIRVIENMLSSPVPSP